MCFGTSGLCFHKKESEITGSIEISRYPPVANECARHLEAVRERPGMVMYLPLLNDARVRNLEVATSMADHPWSTFGMSQERTSAWELGPILPHVRDGSSQTSSEYISCGLNECCFDHRLHVRHEPHSADVPNDDHRIGWMEMADFGVKIALEARALDQSYVGRACTCLLQHPSTAQDTSWLEQTHQLPKA